MKRIISAALILIMLLLTLSSCGAPADTTAPATTQPPETETQPTELPTEPESNTDALPETYQQSIRDGFSESAAKIGFTLDNYPIIDGAVDTHDISVALADAFLKESLRHTPALVPYPEKNDGADKSYAMLLRGEIEVVIAPLPSQAVKEKINDSGMKLRTVPLGKKALVFFTQSTTELSNITLNDINKAYILGESDLTAFYPKTLSSFTDKFTEEFLAGYKISESTIITDDIASSVSTLTTPAIGFGTPAQAEAVDTLKLLTVNDIAPLNGTALNPEYPLTIEYYLVYNEDSQNAEVLSHLAEFLVYGAGSNLLKKCGLYFD